MYLDNVTTNNVEDNRMTVPARRKRQSSVRIAQDHYKSVMCCKCRRKKHNTNCDLKMCLTCCINSSRKCFHRSHIAARGTKRVLWEQWAIRLRKPQPLSMAPYPSSTDNPVHLPDHNKEQDGIACLLAQYKVEQYSSLLLQNGFDTFRAISMLTGAVLDTLGIVPLGHRAVLLAIAGNIKVEFPDVHRKL
jgi:hypothetical protein